MSLEVTFQAKLGAAIKQYSDAENRFTILTDAVGESTQQILTIAESLISKLALQMEAAVSKDKASTVSDAANPPPVASKDNPQELALFGFKKIYGKLQALYKEHAFAVATLTELNNTLTECTPKNVGLEPDQIAYVTGLGVDISQYPAKEVECSALIQDLTTKIAALSKTIEKTKVFIDKYPMGLETASRHLHQITRGKKTWGDLQPDSLLTTPHYFMKGYQQFLDSNPKSSQEPTADDLLILGTLSTLERTKQLPHHRQPAGDFAGTNVTGEMKKD